MTGRNEEVLKEVAKAIGGTYVVADLTEDGACQRVIEEATQSLGGLTTLVNRWVDLLTNTTNLNPIDCLADLAQRGSPEGRCAGHAGM